MVRKVFRSFVDFLTGGLGAAPAEKLHLLGPTPLVWLAYLFSHCFPSCFHLFFAYVSALKLQQEIWPEEVAVAEEVGRERLHDANAFDLFGSA